MKQTVATIKELLASDDRAVERGIVALYERQTGDEQAINATLAANGIGFSAYDAEYLSALARQIIRNESRKPEGYRLKERQMMIARRKIMRYAGQLVEIAAVKARAVPLAEGVIYSQREPVIEKPCFIATCPNPRMDDGILCESCALDPLLVEKARITTLTAFLPPL